MTTITRAAFWGADGSMLAESIGAHAQRAYDAALAATNARRAETHDVTAERCARESFEGPAPAQPDPLTVAYIAIGAASTYGDIAASITVGFGQSEYIADCIQHAPMLDRLAPQIQETDANFYYEFAELFGAYYGAELLVGWTPDAAALAAEILAELPQS